MFKVWCWVCFWLAFLFVAIDALCAIIEFSIGQKGQGFECLFWAVICAAAAWLDYMTAKSAKDAR